MLLDKSRVQGAYIVELEPRFDERGFFARTWCQKEFAAYGLNERVVQINVSHNTHKATLRGLHYQAAPFEEAKTISCTRGAIYDVVLDLRNDSSTYLRWDAVELSARNRRMLYVPEGCAHGFQTLADDTEVLYLMSQFYSPDHARGVRYDDPAFHIEWPLPVSVLAEADRTWPDYERSAHHILVQPTECLS
jgi:dTDP-4-dehydrorhamnose 3,5-epimerase